MLRDFPFARFTFLLKAKDNLALPSYKGSTLRGGFGHAFKRVVCTIRGKPCPECLLFEKCVYSYIFETPPPKDTQIMRKYKAAPHPFVIESPLETKTRYLPGETLAFGLILIGKAIDYLPYFIYTFEDLGKIGIGRGRGKYQLQGARCKVRGGREEIIYSVEDKVLKSNCQVINVSDFSHLHLSSNTLSLSFKTPTRIVYNGNLTLDLEFHILIRNLLRRISLLSYFHCNGNPGEIDFKGLIEKAGNIRVKERDLKWFDWERYSARQETKMKMGGFTGKVSFKGDIEEFLPFIRLGEVIHVGKGTSFGLGRYEILEMV
ncbi:MAG: CRISPR system precrRNA processing endoribonuclease RAMP protein Cas6 [Thermodesulfobacteriota bacterium]